MLMCEYEMWLWSASFLTPLEKALWCRKLLLLFKCSEPYKKKTSWPNNKGNNLRTLRGLVHPTCNFNKERERKTI